MVAEEPSHLSLGAELGPGGVISDYNVNAGPSAVLLYGSVRAAYDFTESWAGQLVLRQWWLPANHATMFGLGGRYEPATVSFGRWFVDGAIGITSTSYAWTYGFDIGGGFEWDIPDVAGLGIGPYVRYGQVINPDKATNNDGRAWTLGASFTYHFGRASGTPIARRRAEGGHFKITIPDTDGDGVPDDEDQCKDVKQGPHPDPFRLGCPEADEDGDGVPDSDDACPLVPPGDKPDPKRPGCPLIDSDGDGIADVDDACPNKPGVASPEPSKNGCPAPRKHGAVEEEGGPPPESNPAPKSVRKRGMH
jgi:hypothetical protein